MNFPGWIPEPVRPLLQQLNANPACAGRRRPIFDRLLEDDRMQSVYGQFLRKNRKTGKFYYPARNRNSDHSAEDAQIAALREVLKVTINAASDKISASTFEQIAEAGKRWSDHAVLLRMIAHDMTLASELGMLGLNDPAAPSLVLHDIATLLRVANWLDHLKSALRLSDDPLVVDRHRGDPIVRGVQIMISVKLEEQFGARLDGTAATLTEVALDAKTSPRASRSALTKKNR
jgi:hypothetical protein